MLPWSGVGRSGRLADLAHHPPRDSEEHERGGDRGEDPLGRREDPAGRPEQFGGRVRPGIDSHREHHVLQVVEPGGRECQVGQPVPARVEPARNQVPDHAGEGETVKPSVEQVDGLRILVAEYLVGSHGRQVVVGLLTSVACEHQVERFGRRTDDVHGDQGHHCRGERQPRPLAQCLEDRVSSVLVEHVEDQNERHCPVQEPAPEPGYHALLSSLAEHSSLLADFLQADQIHVCFASLSGINTLN